MHIQRSACLWLVQHAQLKNPANGGNETAPLLLKQSAPQMMEGEGLSHWEW
jgi:hypothetical protein